MNECLHCGAPVPVGFSTCSPECTIKDRNGEPKPGEESQSFDTIPDGVETITGEELARMLGVSTATVFSWKFKRKIPAYQLGPRRCRFSYEAVCKALGRELPPVPGSPENPVVGYVVDGGAKGATVKVLLPGRPPATPDWIQRGLVAAKEAFRDVMLERADEAQARGDHKERADALEDYIFFEESLKVAYQKREERQK